MKKTFFLFLITLTSAFGQSVVYQNIVTTNRTAQTNYSTSAKKNLIIVDGDSLMKNFSLDVISRYMATEVCAQSLRDQGYPVTGVNIAASGNTSTSSLNKCYQYNLFGIPKIVFLYIGANDTGGGLSTNLTTTNIVCCIQAARFGAVNWAATETDLPSLQQAGTRFVVRVDGGSNGGAAAFAGYTATITGAGNAAMGNIWECRNANAGTNGWGRIATVATTPTHCQRFVVVGMGYQNFTSGGDNGATPSSYPGIRGAQQRAVTYVNNSNVIYYDLYAAMYNLIVIGQVTQSSGSWHRNGTNQHYNEVGESYIGQFYASVINAQSGWLASLK